MNSGHGTIALMEKEGIQAAREVNGSGQHETQPNRRFYLSVVTPAYNEAANLPLLYRRISEILTSMDLDWEWIVVDDHSTDHTFKVVADIALRDLHLRAIRF